MRQITIILMLLLIFWVPPVAPEVVHKQINPANWITHVSGDSWQPEGFVNGTPVPAVFQKTPGIVLDGVADEPAWSLAREVAVHLSHGSVSQVHLKAVYTDEDIYLRVRWADDDENRQHHPWQWNADEQAWQQSIDVEDSVLLSFEAGCEWSPSFLAGYVYDFDGWHWLAGRSDPLGQALDLVGTMQDTDRKNQDSTPYQSRNQADVWNMKFTENTDVDLYADWDELDRVYMFQPVAKTIYYQGAPDGFRPPAYVKALAPPADEPVESGQTYPSFKPIELEGQAGEVSARGQWQDGYWTVEFKRQRITPARTLNDTVFNRMVQFSVHVFDQAERIDESSESGRLFLQFLPPEPMLVEE